MLHITFKINGLTDREESRYHPKNSHSGELRSIVNLIFALNVCQRSSDENREASSETVVYWPDALKMNDVTHDLEP
jgi:hypothetical protein